jgi:sugar diacid utilization regulator
MSEIRVAAIGEQALDPDEAISLARSALQQAALANPALSGIERLLDDFVTSARSPEASAMLAMLDGAADVDAEQLAVPLSGARLVVVQPSEPRHLAVLLSGLVDDRQPLAIVHGGCLNVLVRNVPRRAGDDMGLRNARRVAAVVSRLQPDVHVGISGPLTPDVSLAAAARDARDAAALAAQRGCHQLCVDDVWGEIVVARLREVLSTCLTTDHPLARLAEHDRRTRSDLGATVGAWLAHCCDTAETAQSLSLHPNTLRYRLRRAQEVSGLDLFDPTQSLVAQLLNLTTRRTVAPA